MVKLIDDISYSISKSGCPKVIMAGIGFAFGAFVAVIVLVPALSLRSNRMYETSNDFVIDISTEEPILIAAFNIKSFGESKWNDEFASSYIVEILLRYDIVLIQEVRDKSGCVLHKLWHQLNSTGVSYGLVYSERLGRTTYKEQYAFFFRNNLIRVTDVLQFNDSERDVFEREPFTAEFEYWSVKYQSWERIALLALHTKPKDALRELSHLPDVVRETFSYFPKSQGVIALGDLNADCDYLKDNQKQTMELFRTKGSFRNLIDDSVDTTVAASTDCAYDRAVVFGDRVATLNASVFNFQTVYNLNEADAKRISDHYPIEFKLL